ncbi:MAG: hypothetical protein FWC36_02355 [Spirochaetes bacterium]|nr:hypothetical protein [Spirochaetota bacterium]
MSNNINMKKHYYTIYIILSIVFFLFLFSFSLYNLTQKYKYGIENGQLSFNRIKNNITTLYLSNNDFSSPVFKNSINNFFNSNLSLQSIVIYDNDGKVEFLHIKNPLILAKKPIATNDFITRPEYKFNNFIFNLYSSSIIIPGNRNLSIEAVYKVVEPSEILDIIKIAIISLLAYITLTASFLLFVPFGSGRKNFEGKQGNITIQTEDNNNTAIKYTPLIKEINKSINDNINKEEPPISISENIPEIPSDINIVEPLDTITDSAVIIDQKTGLADIEHLSSKLSYELDKAISNDTDLSFALLSLMSGDKDKITVFYDNLPLLLRTFFIPQMSFRFSENKLAIIMPDKTIEESVQKIDEFVVRLKNISAIENIYAGISSRNIRIISAERLIKETESAISKATSGPDHIVAFKSDPEKYREMIAKQILP